MHRHRSHYGSRRSAAARCMKGENDANDACGCARCCAGGQCVKLGNGAICLSAGIRVCWWRLSADGIAGIFQPSVGRSIRRGRRGSERLSGSGSRGRGSRWGTRHRSRHSQRHRWYADGQSTASGLPLRLSVVQRLLLREPLRLNPNLRPLGETSLAIAIRGGGCEGP